MSDESRQKALELAREEAGLYYANWSGQIDVQSFRAQSPQGGEDDLVGPAAMRAAQGFFDRGVILAVCMRPDEFLRSSVELPGDGDADMYAGILRKRFLFLQAEPSAVSEFFSFTAGGWLMSDYVSEREQSLVYVCARIDPSQLDISVFKAPCSAFKTDRSSEGVLLKYRRDPMWGMLSFARRGCRAGVAGAYRATEIPLTAGSRAVRRGYCLPVCSRREEFLDAMRFADDQERREEAQ